MNVLIVDDDYVDREHVKRILGRSDPNCQFTEADSVDMGIECFQAQQFDVVLLDYRMPQRDGIELLLELRSGPKGQAAAIVMLSNSDDDELSMSCVRAGAQDFLAKSDLTHVRLRRAILHAQIRYQLEMDLLQSYHEAKRLAEHDSLTGLANRLMFEVALKDGVANNLRGNLKLALLLFDVDNFKFINDSHGHDIGDLLLKELVVRVLDCLRGNELFARLGGDEFAVVLNYLKHERDVSQVAQRILAAFKTPFVLSGIKINVSISIGIVIHPDNSGGAEELFKFADIAMYRAKKLGRNQIVFFEEKMQRAFLARYHIEHQLKDALWEKQFLLHYQPLFEPVQQTLLGFEALIRWQLGDDMRMPDSFIEIAEESGQILGIGRWVIESSLQQLGVWLSHSGSPLTLSINLSPDQFHDKGLIKFIQLCLDKYKIPPEYVTFELTETAFIKNADEHVELLHNISRLGCRIALDDFGTGFSSVSHLHKFPIDTVKIDKSLMLAKKDEKTLALIRGLVVLIRSLGMDIVAEGIETQHSLDLCCDLGIEKVQGYYLARPVPVAEIESLYLNAVKIRK